MSSPQPQVVGAPAPGPRGNMANLGESSQKSVMPIQSGSEHANYGTVYNGDKSPQSPGMPAGTRRRAPAPRQTETNASKDKTLVWIWIVGIVIVVAAVLAIALTAALCVPLVCCKDDKESNNNTTTSTTTVSGTGPNQDNLNEGPDYTDTDAHALTQANCAEPAANWNRFSSQTGQAVMPDIPFWVRASVAVPQAKIYSSNEINSKDIYQGNLGDCWFLSAMGAIADTLGEDGQGGQVGANWIRNVTLQHVSTRNTDGKYVINIFDLYADRWYGEQMDNYLAFNTGYKEGSTDNGNQLFFARMVKENGETMTELWAPLVEKAVAQWLRGYGWMNGGYPVIGFYIMTGCKNYRFYDKKGANKNNWEEKKIMMSPDAKGKKPWEGIENSPIITGGAGDVTTDAMWTWLKANSVKYGVTAEIHDKRIQNGNTYTTHDLVDRHAYSLIQMVDFSTGAGSGKYVYLRNPWGGASSSTAEQKEIDDKLTAQQAAQLRAQMQDTQDSKDGKFIITWELFLDIFEVITVAECALTSDNYPAGI